jgi:hypothetical protein
MDWGNAIGHILDRYAGAGGGTASAPADVHSDFDQVAQTAPHGVMADGLANAFRSSQTPSFPEMVAGLFRNSNAEQRAGLLNRLLGAAGPGALAGILGSGNRQVTPEQADSVPPEQVQQAAAEAQQRNPSIIDDVSSFYAQHPGVVKALGGLALSIALQHMVRRR